VCLFEEGTYLGGRGGTNWRIYGTLNLGEVEERLFDGPLNQGGMLILNLGGAYPKGVLIQEASF